MDATVGLARRFVVDFFNRHDGAVCDELMTDDYTLRIGGSVISGRERYVPAVQGQFDQFPGLGMTVHALVASGDRVAVAFSEHGASGGDPAAGAAWSGVALYRVEGGRLAACCAEEDYLARRRQLTGAVVDPVDPPAPAPWDTVARPPDAEAEAVVRRWLEGGGIAPASATRTDGVRRDDEHRGGAPLVFDVVSTVVNELFSAGPEVAFHVEQRGHHRSGLVDDGEAPSGPLTLASAGIVSVADGEVRSGRVVRDRAGLLRARRASAAH